MFRRVTCIALASFDIDTMKNTYVDALGLAPPIRATYHERGRRRLHALFAGDDIQMHMEQPLDSPETPGPGGGMARFIQHYGEGLYLITVALGDNNERYSKRLESKGAKIYWDVPDSGAVTGGQERSARVAVSRPVHPLIHPRSAHGVVWELGTHYPAIVREKAPPSNAFKKVVAISVVCRDNDVAVKTYTDVLELDQPVYSTVYEKGGYKEHTIPIGDVCLQLLQPVAGPDAPGRGGDMARFLRERGEGLYMITVAVDDLAGYARKLEGKGVKVQRFQPETGKATAGPTKPPIPAGTEHVLIDPKAAHGVRWEVTPFPPTSGMM